MFVVLITVAIDSGRSTTVTHAVRDARIGRIFCSNAAKSITRRFVYSYSYRLMGKELRQEYNINGFNPSTASRLLRLFHLKGILNDG